MLQLASADVKFVHFDVIIPLFLLWIGTRNHFQYWTETHRSYVVWRSCHCGYSVVITLQSSLRQHKREADWITYYL